MFVILDGTAHVEWRGRVSRPRPGHVLRRAHPARAGRHAHRARARGDRDALPRDSARRRARARRVGADDRARDAARRSPAASPPRFRTTEPLASRSRYTRRAVAKPTPETKLIAENRRARRDYELIERVEAGRCPHRHRGEVRARRPGPARAGLRGRARRRGLAHRSVDLRVRTGRAARATSPTATASSSSIAARSTRSTARCGRRASRSSRRGCTSRTAA